jgi:hypothetical protein
MTAPEGGMEEALRRGLAEAVGRIEPGADGLGRIRARIGDRPPRPWLLAVGADTLGAARHWVWRGHWSWAWPAALPAPVGGALARVPRLPLPRLRRLPRPGELLRLGSVRSGRTAPRVDVGWLRPVGVLAVVALIASVSFGVQPFRQAIIQASNTVLSGGPSQPSGGAGTDGSGSQAGNGTGSQGAGGAQSGASGSAPGAGAGATKSRGAASARPTESATCVASVTADVTSTAPASSVPPAATVAGTAASASERTAELLVRTLRASGRPSPSPSPSPTCASPTPSVTPTPATSGGVPTMSATPTVGDTSATPTASPTPTDTGSGSPTATPTETSGGSPTDSPTDSGGGSGDTGNGGTTDTGTAAPGSS